LGRRRQTAAPAPDDIHVAGQHDGQHQLAGIAGAASLWAAIAADMGASLLVIFNGLRLIRP
jgi:Cd2+/Zn2+-exporting ATPase